MNSEINLKINNYNNYKQLQQKLFLELKNNVKEKEYSVIIKKLISIKEITVKIIDEIVMGQSNDKILDQELISNLSFFKSLNSQIKDSNISFEIKEVINNILINIFEAKNFSYISEPLLLQECIKTSLNLTYNNNKSELIFFLLRKKIDNFILYIIANYPNYKESIQVIRKSFKDNHSEMYLHYKQELKNLDIYNLSKSKKIEDRKKALFLLSQLFNNFKYFIEKYEFLNLIALELFPSLLNLTLPNLSHKKDLKNIDLYINFGKFLLKFLFTHEYIFDFNDFSVNPEKISNKYPCVFFYNKNEIISLDILNSKKYKILYKYELIKEYSKDLFDIVIYYFVKPMIIYDTNFEIQFIIFKLIKHLYFICQNENEDIKNKLNNYISEVLNNLSSFKKQDEFNLALESREFGYYILLKDQKFKYMIKSLTSSPKNESDIYTTKFKISDNLLNDSLYEKEEIEIGKTFEIVQKLYKKFSIIYLEFYVEDNKEITFTVYKKNEKEKDYEQIGFNNIIKTVKNDDNHEKEENYKYKIAKIIIINSSSFNNNENELNYKNAFKIIFDNYDSWFSNRILHYSISVFDTNDI